MVASAVADGVAALATVFVAMPGMPTARHAARPADHLALL